jgi:ribonuclease T2
VSSPRSRKAQAALAVAVIGAVMAWYSQRQPPQRMPHAPARTAPIREETRERAKPVIAEARSRAAGFDFYLMTMSVHAAFCADGHERLPECAARAPRPLVIHGLWPERLRPGAYPRDCPAPRFALAPSLARELERYMPGMRSNLHEHEWRKHGACAGIDADVYFGAALALARSLNAALAPTLTTMAGRETTVADLRAAAERYRPGLGATLVFQCRTLRDAPGGRRRPYLVEVRQCLDNDGEYGEPGTPLDCATVDRRDQGCGRSFLIAEQAAR